MYEEDDLRGKYVFEEGKVYKNPYNNNVSTSSYGYTLRTAEFYLNRAEAHIKKGEIASGMAGYQYAYEQLDMLRVKYRIKPMN